MGPIATHDLAAASCLLVQMATLFMYEKGLGWFEPNVVCFYCSIVVSVAHSVQYLPHIVLANMPATDVDTIDHQSVPSRPPNLQLF